MDSKIPRCGLIELNVKDHNRLAKGVGLIVFGLLWTLTGDVISSFLIAFGTYLVIDSLGGRQG